MNLKYLSEEGITHFKVNDSFYSGLLQKESNESLVEYWNDQGWLKESNIECSEIKFDYTELENVRNTNIYNEADYNNIKIIHNTLGKVLSPDIALEDKFWLAFSVLYCWDYIHYRKSTDFANKKSDYDIVKQFLNKKESQKRRLFVHCVSRLYWADKLLYDAENKNNPFWVIKELMYSNFSSQLVLMSGYNILMNKNICLGIMDALLYLKNNGKKLDRTNDFTYTYKYIDSIGGAMLLDSYSRNEIKKLVLNNYNIQ